MTKVKFKHKLAIKVTSHGKYEDLHVLAHENETSYNLEIHANGRKFFIVDF